MNRDLTPTCAVFPQHSLESTRNENLLERVRSLKSEGFRLVQIGATRFPDHLELTYSFDRERSLTSLRVELTAANPQVESITSVFWGAFLYENELHDLFGLRVNGLAVDFHGQLYRTMVKFPFGSTKPPTPAMPSAASNLDPSKPERAVPAPVASSCA